MICPKCNYFFNLTKDVKSKQVGSTINVALTNIFNKFKNEEPLELEDLKDIRKKNLLEDERFENSTKKSQKEMLSWIKAVSKEFFNDKGDPEPENISNVAHFICKFCKNTLPIKPGTLIHQHTFVSNSASNDTSDITNYEYAKYDQTLARTRTYICKNEDCVSHKDADQREAVLTKNDRHQLIYICTACSFHWTSNV